MCGLAVHTAPPELRSLEIECPHCVCVCVCAHVCAGPCALAGNRESNKQVGRGRSSGPPSRWLGRTQESGRRGLNPGSTAYERASVSPSVKE